MIREGKPSKVGKYLRDYWVYILALIPSLTEWADDGHLPTKPREATTDIIMTLIMVFMLWMIVKEKKELKKLLIRDKLTALYNSRHLRTELDYQVTLAHRTLTPLSMIFIDLDNFKSVNDAYGHTAGDEVLRQFSKSLLECTRKEMDLCFRLGGDEFVVLCQHTRIPHAMEIAERILYSFRSVEEFREKQISLSLGVTELRYMETPHDFLKRSDQSMYGAKKSGKNRIHCEQAP